jgi:hypothetical protein
MQVEQWNSKLSFLLSHLGPHRLSRLLEKPIENIYSCAAGLTTPSEQDLSRIKNIYAFFARLKVLSLLAKMEKEDASIYEEVKYGS